MENEQRQGIEAAPSLGSNFSEVTTGLGRERSLRHRRHRAIRQGHHAGTDRIQGFPVPVDVRTVGERMENNQETRNSSCSNSVPNLSGVTTALGRRGTSVRHRRHRANRDRSRDFPFLWMSGGRMKNEQEKRNSKQNCSNSVLGGY